MENQALIGDCTEVLKQFDDESIDCIVTDPPYGISFMGKEWDKALPSLEALKECNRVLKAGAFGFFMCAPRMDVLWRMGQRLEEAGFRVDFSFIGWSYASGFPKAAAIDKLIDKRNGRNQETYKPFAEYLKQKRLEKNLSMSEIDRILGTNTAYSWWEGRLSGIQLPSKFYYLQLKELLDLDSRFDDLIEREEAEREIIGIKKGIETHFMRNSDLGGGYNSEYEYKPNPATDKAREFSGAFAGAQFKPALECIIQAEKPLSIEAQLTIITSNTIYTLGELEKCLDLEQNLEYYTNVNNVESNFTLLTTVKEYFAQRSAMDYLVEEAIAVCGKVGGLYDLTDMSKYILELKEMEPQIIPSNTVWLWKSILVDLLSKVNKFTIEMATDQIIELKTLNSLLCQSIQENTITASKTPQNGKKLNVNIVESYLLSVLDRLKSLNQTTVLGNVGSNTLELKNQKSNANTAETSLKYGVTTSLEKENTVLKNAITNTEKPKIETEVIICAMKKLSPSCKTYVDQALQNGKGCTWLDSVRIPCEAPRHDEAGRVSGKGWTEQGGSIYYSNPDGRFPANLLVSDNCLDNGIITKSNTRKVSKTEISNDSYRNSYVYGKYGECVYDRGQNDSGQFSRYFSLDAWFDKKINELPENIQKTFPFLITPKPSKSEKNKYIENKHPTVKPLKLMSYLITLGSREGDIILDPYAGSGTTLEACKLLNRVFIGIDKDPENEKYMIARGQLNENTLEAY